MDRIRVDTEELRKSAKDIAASADAIGKAGDEILAVAASLPSYEGQLSGPARKAGYEIQSQLRDLKTALAADSDSLLKTAQAFETVDAATVQNLGENTALLSSGGQDGGLTPIRQGGSPTFLGFDFLAYQDYGYFVEFWRNGETIIIPVTDENRELIKKYEDYLDEYFKKTAEFFNIFNFLDQQYGNTVKLLAVLGLLVGLGILTGKVFTAVLEVFGLSLLAEKLIKETAEQALKMSGLDPYDIIKECGKILDPVNPEKWFPELKRMISTAQESSEAFNNANEIWNELYTQPPLPESPSIPAPTPPTITQTPPPSTSPSPDSDPKPTPVPTP
jgi:uncharacterized protein YukE